MHGGGPRRGRACTNVAAGKLEKLVECCREFGSVLRPLRFRGTSPEHVSVLESDGSTFVVAGHPSYGEACAEV
jgi:hypothetical protein